MSGQTIVFGILVPAAVFVFSYWMTDLLYKHFAREQDERERSGRVPPGD